MRYTARVITVCLVGILMSCAHEPTVSQRIDTEVKKEPPVATGGDLAASSRRLIQEAEGLSPQQKEKLIGLHTRMAGEMVSFRGEEGKLKMLFFRKLLDPKAPESEISNLRRRILNLERKKTNRMLGAFEEAKEILGRTPPEDDRLYRAFLMNPHEVERP